MKTILFDLLGAQPEGSHKFHGGGEYIKALFKCICEQYLSECRVIVFYDETLYIDQWIIELIEQNCILRENITSRSEINKLFEKYEIDVFYSGLPYSYQKTWIPEKVKKRGTIHGLREIELPYDKYEYMYRNNRTEKYKCIIKPCFKKQILKKHMVKFQRCIDLLDEIVCVSNHTKYAIQANFPNNSKEIKVFYTPNKCVEGIFTGDSKFSNKYGKYILLISGDRWIKNAYRAIFAIDELISKGGILDYKIVIVGKIPTGIKRKIKNISNFVNLEYLETMELEDAYKGSSLFIYPTLNEGFGMPPMEAMKYGKTCIVSAVCSLPEVYGDSVYYFNPYDILEIQNRILQALEIPKGEEMIKEQLERIQTKQEDDLREVCKFIIS